MPEAMAGWSNRRKKIFLRWCAVWPFTAILILYPINNLPFRIATLAAFTVLWAGILYFFWQRRFVRFAAFGCAGAVVIFMALPGRQPDVNKLRHNYIDALNKYEGTKYIWGGENRLGIDCSGLLRSGLILADYEQGLRTGNPALVRDGFSLWWHDCSARALGEEYRHQTRLLFSAGSINAIDDSMLLPGDIAVTRSGVHTLAYLGDRVWIEAEPNAGKVIHVTAPVHDPWFEEPVNILRWSQLDQTNSGR